MTRSHNGYHGLMGIITFSDCQWVRAYLKLCAIFKDLQAQGYYSRTYTDNGAGYVNDHDNIVGLSVQSDRKTVHTFKWKEIAGLASQHEEQVWLLTLGHGLRKESSQCSCTQVIRSQRSESIGPEKT